MSEFDYMPEMKTGLRAAVDENRRMEHIALKAKIADYKPHTCYIDNQEGVCSVCADIDQMEHALSLLEPHDPALDGDDPRSIETIHDIAACDEELTPEAVLRDLQAWLKHMLEGPQETKGHVENCGHPKLYNALLVPDWQAKQKLDNVTECLNRLR